MSATNKAESGFSRGLNCVENFLMSGALIVMVVVVFAQIVFRYMSAVDMPSLGRLMDVIRDIAMVVLPWSEELARYAMIWAVFIGAGMGARAKVHVGVDAFVRLFPRSLLLASVIVSGLCCVGFSLSLTWLGSIMVSMMWRSGQTSPAMEVPMFWAYLAVPVGGLLIALRFFQATVEKIREISADREVAA